MVQSPKTSQGGASCQARCNYHPWRQYSLYSLNLQLDNGGGSSHPCPPLDCLKRWQSDHTCHHLHRFNELATKWKVEWEAQTGMCRWSTSTFEISCGCTALDMLEWRETTEQVDWQAKQPSQVACFSELWSVEKHETLPVGTKPRTSHHWSPGGERHWKKC